MLQVLYKYYSRQKFRVLSVEAASNSDAGNATRQNTFLPVQVEGLLVVPVVKIHSCLPQSGREVVALLASVFKKVLGTVELPLAQIENALAYPRQLRHVIDPVGACEMAECRGVLIVPCGSVGALRSLLDRVSRERVEDANTAHIKRPPIIRVESFGFGRERFDDLVQDTSEMRLGSLSVVLHLTPRAATGMHEVY